MNGDLNDMIRQQGEPTYYTPPTVYGNLIENHDGGQVTIINPPFEERPLKKQWKKSIRIFHRWFITFSNCRVKKRYDSSNHTCNKKLNENIKGIKIKHYYKVHHGRCPMCGEEHTFREMEMHHVLPWARFPEVRSMEKNMLMLCHRCHKEVHMNPWLNIRLMKVKAAELGIDLKDRYDYGEGDEHCPA